MERIVYKLLIIILLILSGCTGQEEDRSIRFGLSGFPENLHPLYATDALSVRVGRLIYQPLVDFDDRDRPVPRLADWERVEPRRYLFRLRPGLPAFSDGRHLTADDVAATYAFVLDEDNASPLRAPLELITAVRVIDERTLSFELSRADPHFPAYLGLGIVPAASLQGARGDAPPPGNGPFEIVGGDERTILRLRRRVDGQAVELVAVRDPIVRVLKLLRGEIHLLQNDLPPELFAYLEQQLDIEVASMPGSNFSYLGFNLEDPVTGDIRVRKAIAHGIDREAIGHHLFHDRVDLAQGLFPARHWLGAPLPAHEFDPAKARRLLAESGFDKDRPLVLSYKTSSDAFRLRLASVLQAQLAGVGIALKLQSYDWGTFFGDIKKGNFQLYGLTWVGLKTPDSFRYLFHSDSAPPGGANRGRYRSAEADHLIARAERLEDPQDQAPLYRALQKVLLEELPYVPLWYEHQVAALRKEIQGYRLAADGNYDGLVDVTWRQ